LERALHRVEEVTHPLLGVVIDGRYRIHRVIGRGGRGVVFEAENLAMGRAVAVKICIDRDWENLERLSREARIIASLQHPNVHDVYDFGWLGGYGPYLVSERLAGETLANYQHRRRKISARKAVDLVVQILCGLHAAHVRNVVHRDVKPKNVFLVDRVNCPPLVKVMDFGLAKDLSLVEKRGLTQPGTTLGTLEYMSPEQVRGEPLGGRSDVFSVGVIAYELITGEHPFRAGSAFDTQCGIIEKTPRPLRTRRPDISERLDASVMLALEKSPEARFPNAVAFQRALLDSLASAPVRDEDATPSAW
jgi:serine/threonine-protein kinase